MVAQVPTHRVRRRELIAGIGVGAALWPLGAAAQEPPKHRIGMLVLGNGVGSAFGESLRALGYTDRNTTIEVRAAHGRMERFPNLAAELAALSPAVIYAMTPHAVEAARVAKPQTPIVMLNVADPVALGFVASLAHPGGNITGLANLAEETTAKRLELLKSAVPGLRRMAVLVDPNNPGNVHQWDAAQRAAPSLGVLVFWRLLRRRPKRRANSNPGDQLTPPYVGFEFSKLPFAGLLASAGLPRKWTWYSFPIR